MKILGIVFCVFAALNFIVMLIALFSYAPTEVVTRKLASTVLLGLIGIVLYYYDKKKKGNAKKIIVHYETESYYCNAMGNLDLLNNWYGVRRIYLH